MLNISKLTSNLDIYEHSLTLRRLILRSLIRRKRSPMAGYGNRVSSITISDSSLREAIIKSHQE